MNETVILADLKDAIGTGMTLTPQTPLADIPEWDSVSMMTVLTVLATQYRLPLQLADIQQSVVVADIIALVKKSR